MAANTHPGPAVRPEPFAGPPRCGGELVAGRLSGWYIRRVRRGAGGDLVGEQTTAAGALATEGAPR